MKTKANTMKTKARITLFGLVMVIALCYANFANAESNVATGVAAQSGGSGASAMLNFRIVIPEFIYFRVGSSGGTIDTVNFEPTADDVYNGTAGIAATAGSGAVNVRLVSNAGGVRITPSNNSSGAGLGDGGGVNYISYAQINSASDDPALPAPALLNSGGTSVDITPNVNANVTNITATWTYTYNNPADPPAAGIYGTAANGGQVTYTAAVP